MTHMRIGSAMGSSQLVSTNWAHLPGTRKMSFQRTCSNRSSCLSGATCLLHIQTSRSTRFSRPGSSSRIARGIPDGLFDHCRVQCWTSAGRDSSTGKSWGCTAWRLRCLWKMAVYWAHVWPAAGAEHAACKNSWNLSDPRSHSSYHSWVWGTVCAATLPSGQGSVLVTAMGGSATGTSVPPCLVGGMVFFLWHLGGAACASESSDSELFGRSGSKGSGCSQGNQVFCFFSDVSVAGGNSDCREPAVCTEGSRLTALCFDDEILVTVRGVSLCWPLKWLS